MDNINFSTMSLSDLENIKDILYSDFDDYWDYSILKEELEAKNSIYIIAKSEEKIIGFAGIKIIFDEAELMNIVIHKSYRNRGLGTKLLKRLIEICTSKNISSIFLEVNENNIFAQKLYKNFEFKELSLRKNYYNKDNCIVMKKSLK